MNLHDLKQIEANFAQELSIAQSLPAIETLRVKYLGAKGSIKLALKAIKTFSKEDKISFATEANRLADTITAQLEAKKALLNTQWITAQMNAEWIDLSLPGTIESRGAIHPVCQVIDQCLNYLGQLGFELVEGNEVETAYYNFDALNIPEHHPARELQDTFWLNDQWLLRTHTTSVQARILQQQLPLPIKKVVAGRVYRNEAVDATHLAMCHQLDGFWVDKHLTFAHLKGVSTFLAKKLYGEHQKIRFKPKYYPYTEPSIGIDIECHLCHGAGCVACQHAGWITVIGGGMIHSQVLSRFGYDPATVSGIAFGWGITRMATQFYKLSKSRPLYTGDMRWLYALNHRSL